LNQTRTPQSMQARTSVNRLFRQLIDDLEDPATIRLMLQGMIEQLEPRTVQDLDIRQAWLFAKLLYIEAGGLPQAEAIKWLYSLYDQLCGLPASQYNRRLALITASMLSRMTTRGNPYGATAREVIHEHVYWPGTPWALRRLAIRAMLGRPLHLEYWRDQLPG